ncbi:MAG: hypothetical protein V4719_24440 [Planctomycetota bacterium]|jgi:hypothetical protein
MKSRIGLSLGLLLVAGCQAPWIQVPSIVPGNPASERASYTLHDPLPDSSLGPNVGGRPRESLVQRSEPRRTIEAAIPGMTNQQPPGLGGPQMMPPPQSAYPNAVAP